MFHHPYLYKFHKVHHEWKSPIPWSAMYCHPLEHLIVNLGSALIGPLMIGMCIQDTIIWSFVVTYQSLLAHGGEYPKITEHDIHHKLQVYNYGTGTYMDKFHKTYFNPKEL